MAVLQPSQPSFHGYAPSSASRGYRPPLSIVISRETGARGRSIAERVADLLGWEYVDQESLEYLTQGPPSGTSGEREMSSDVSGWMEARVASLTSDGTLVRAPEVTPLVRGILAAAAAEHCVILGRGAGRVLPSEARLHVKIVAPLELRVAFVAQLRRFSHVEAEQYLQEKDRSREEFLAAKLRVDSNDLAQYDLVINTAQFGVEASAQLISVAAREKETYLSTMDGRL